MTKDVLISVSGVQFGPAVDGEKVEVITPDYEALNEAFNAEAPEADPGADPE